GAASAEHLRQLLWTSGVAAGTLSAEQFVAVTAAEPARLFGLDQKGAIAVGMDADIVVWDPDASFVVDATRCVSALDYCMFEGHGLTGAAVATLRRGELLWNGADSVAEPGSGRFIPRSLSPAGEGGSLAHTTVTSG